MVWFPHPKYYYGLRELLRFAIELLLEHKANSSIGILVRSDPCAEKGLSQLDFFRLDCFGPSYRQSSRIVFALFLEAVGVRECCCMAVESQLEVGSSVLRASSANNACFALDESSSKPVGGVGLGRKPPKLRVRGVALS